MVLSLILRRSVVEACLSVYEQAGLLRGRSGWWHSMDVAKVVSVLARGEQSLPDIYGVGQVTSSRMPLFLAPTTAGTGSGDACCHYYNGGYDQSGR